MIYFVRHGESEANLKHVFAGQRDDTALTAEGEAQAKNAGDELRATGLTFDRIVTSPLQRTRRTAEIIAVELGLPAEAIVVEPRLAEYDMGALTGKPIHEITPKELVSSEGAEDPYAFHDRVQAALADLHTQPGNTIIVSHAGVSRMIEAVKQQTDVVDFYGIAPYPNGRAVKLDD